MIESGQTWAGKVNAGATGDPPPDELGLDVPEERRPDVLHAVKRRGSEKRGLVDDDEFREPVSALAGLGP